MAEILIGDYGLITNGVKGVEVTAAAGDHIAEGTWVEITTADAAGPWAIAGLKVGDPYYEPNPDASALALVVNDAYLPITEGVLGFARSWQIEFTRNPIDTTALVDTQSTNIYGRPTLTGTLGGFLVTNDDILDAATQRFVETIKIDGSPVQQLLYQNLS